MLHGGPGTGSRGWSRRSLNGCRLPNGVTQAVSAGDLARSDEGLADRDLFGFDLLALRHSAPDLPHRGLACVRMDHRLPSAGCGRRGPGPGNTRPDLPTRRGPRGAARTAFVCQPACDPGRCRSERRETHPTRPTGLQNKPPVAEVRATLGLLQNLAGLAGGYDPLGRSEVEQTLAGPATDIGRNRRFRDPGDVAAAFGVDERPCSARPLRPSTQAATDHRCTLRANRTNPANRCGLRRSRSPPCCTPAAKWRKWEAILLGRSSD